MTAIAMQRSGPVIRVLIADDEPPARRGLRALLSAHADVRVVAEASTGQEAIAAIRSLAPDLVFLDVQMPDGDGFAVIRSIGAEQMPAVIFSTAFDQHALAAFEAQALDYLLKPYDRARLNVTLARARLHLQRRRTDPVPDLSEEIGDRPRYLERLVVRSRARTHFVPVAQVEYFEAEENYVRLHLGEKMLLMRATLSGLARTLHPAKFVRVHRSLVVQVSRVTSATSRPSGEYVLTLTSGRRVVTGRTYRAAVQASLGLKACDCGGAGVAHDESHPM
jgi:two-component system, LytTR family, response regulator